MEISPIFKFAEINYVTALADRKIKSIDKWGGQLNCSSELDL